MDRIFGDLDHFNESENSILYLAEHHTGESQSFTVGVENKITLSLEITGQLNFWRKKALTFVMKRRRVHMNGTIGPNKSRPFLKWLPIDYKEEERLS